MFITFWMPVMFHTCSMRKGGKLRYPENTDIEREVLPLKK